MHSGDPLPIDLFSVSHRTGGSRGAITLRRLRATLRLMFDGRTADDIAGPAGHEPLDIDALRSVASRARSQYMLERVIRRLPGRADDSDRPLPASAGVSGAAALALAFHTGLRLDTGTIAALLDADPEQVGLDLFHARRAIDLSIPVPCEQFAASVSILNDRALDPEERLRYVSHAQTCDRCPAVVEALAALDAELRAEVDAYEQALPEVPLRARASGRIVPIVAVAGVAAVALAALMALSGIVRGSPEPVPVLIGAAPAPHTGWLIQQTTAGEIEAVNLATRHIQPLDGWGMDDQSGTIPVFSPSFQRVAEWKQSSRDFVLTVADVNGGVIQQRTFSLDDAAWWHFAGWYGEDELLIVESPRGPPGETPDAFYARLARESRLLGVDAETGAERVLFVGNVAAARPSPDGARIVLIPPRDQRWPGESFELRELREDGVGALIATVEHRMAEAGMWSPDGQSFYFARIADAEIVPTEFRPGQVISSTTRRYEQLDLAAMDRDGQIRSIWSPEALEDLAIATISPDGATVIFRSGSAQTLGYYRWIFWRIPATGGTPERLVESPHPSGVWSPDGTTLLWSTVTSSYLAGEARDVFGREVPDVAHVAYGPDWTPTIVYGEIGPDPIGARVLAWLPEDVLTPVLDSAQPIDLRGSSAEPARVANAGAGNRIVPDSTASGNGRYVTLHSSNGAMVIWNTEARRGRRLQDGSTGGSWLPNDGGVLDVVQPRGGQATSRLVYYAPQFTRDLDARYDFRQFNPAGLALDGPQYYVSPEFSPDQYSASFFVVDPDQRAASLWVVGWETTAQPVLRWNLPAGSLTDASFQSLWVDERTLLVAQPGNWSEGLPRSVTLVRVVVSGEDIDVDMLIEIGTRPRDHGVMLCEMALSPDGSQVAYRLRHFGERSAESGRSDVLYVAPVSDLGRPLELARGSSGDGIAWSKDSRWVAAGIRGRIALMSVDGREFRYISPDGRRADNPVWLTAHEVWFALENGDTTEIWRVRVD